jgi:hypothetical protein
MAPAMTRSISADDLLNIRAGSRFDLSKKFFVLRRNEHGQFFPAGFLDLAFLRSRLG